ncbi:hypothetical protein [Oricola sp.]|uniref:hypothetical protein n=1 Tax=Oricola sp. TaxID=1979950 RepID=UPI003BAB940E
MPLPKDDPEERTERLVRYVRGALPDDEVEEIARAAAGDPELAADVAVLQAAAGTVRSEAGPADDLGWQRLARDIERMTPTATPRLVSPWWRAGAIAAGLLVAVQGALIVANPGLIGDDSYVAATSGETEFGVTLALDPDAREAEISSLLLEIGARIVDGPGALGIYHLAFDSAEDRTAGLERLRAAPIVETAAPE